jgi:general secretion pathway protein A
MYNVYFGFRQSPFSLSPDPRFLYRSQHHEEALANLIYGVQSRKGFIVMTGEVGTGKTMMLECMRDFLAGQLIEFAYIFNSRINPQQFFEMIAYDLNLNCNRTSKTEVLFALNDMLVHQASMGRTVVLVVDEAHNLEWDVLEEIRLLGNLENRQGKLLQIVLAGQPEFDRMLDAPNLRQLKQRIVLRTNLRNFNEHETTEYVHLRLQKAGAEENTFFNKDLIREVYVRSQGIPRVINSICDNLLLTAFAMEEKVCTMEMLEEVSHDMRLEWPSQNLAQQLGQAPIPRGGGSMPYPMPAAGSVGSGTTMGAAMGATVMRGDREPVTQPSEFRGGFPFPARKK